jgi:hypothetical protein
MTVHQCPECALRFRYRGVLDSHLRDEHPSFRSEYPVAHRQPTQRWPFEADDFPEPGSGAAVTGGPEAARAD